MIFGVELRDNNAIEEKGRGKGGKEGKEGGGGETNAITNYSMVSWAARRRQWPGRARRAREGEGRQRNMLLHNIVD